jgi:hypothetical protein
MNMETGKHETRCTHGQLHGQIKSYLVLLFLLALPLLASGSTSEVPLVLRGRCGAVGVHQAPFHRGLHVTVHLQRRLNGAASEAHVYQSLVSLVMHGIIAGLSVTAGSSPQHPAAGRVLKILLF